ncbi:hypothetical protein LCGC14_0545680 [marine sediment metagenome]|uniref:Uncharacterized protein n=1 Tax=marine sediment metagenome TaxID=412755 RepID=A0A0F9UZN9_9ZZZZ
MKQSKKSNSLKNGGDNCFLCEDKGVILSYKYYTDTDGIGTQFIIKTDCVLCKQ